jgi:hypothetical protein
MFIASVLRLEFVVCREQGDNALHVAFSDFPTQSFPYTIPTLVTSDCPRLFHTQALTAMMPIPSKMRTTIAVIVLFLASAEASDPDGAC